MKKPDNDQDWRGCESTACKVGKGCGDVRTNRFVGLRIGTAVWRRLLISCCTTIAAPKSAHVLRTAEESGRERVQGEEELNPTQTRHAAVGQGSASRMFPAVFFPRAPPTTDRNPPQRQNARQCRRLALSSHRCRPPLLSRCPIHEALRLRCLGRCHGRLSIRLVLLG